MSHCIRETDAARPGITSLFVREQGDAPYRAKSEVKISRGPSGKGGLTVRVVGDTNRGYIAGEDLYALRAFLEELPEEEFIEPAPSKPASVGWVEGDRVHASNNNGRNAWLYVRGREIWNPGMALTPTSSEGSLPVPDETMDRWLLGKGHDTYTVIRRGGKPF